MSPTRRESGPLIVGGEPRIDFLPVETKMRKEIRRKRRSYIALIVMVVIVCIIGVYFTGARAGQIQDQLKTERERTNQLLSEQKKYSEVLDVAGDADTVRSAQLVGSSTEIMWRQVYYDFIKTLPDGAVVASTDIDSQSALEQALVPEAALQSFAVATIFFVLTVPDLATADEVMAGLVDMPAYAYSFTTSVELVEGTYELNIAVWVNADAFERRYFAGGETPDPDAEGEEPTGEGESPTATPTPGGQTPTGTPTPDPTTGSEG